MQVSLTKHNCIILLNLAVVRMWEIFRHPVTANHFENIQVAILFLHGVLCVVLYCRISFSDALGFQVRCIFGSVEVLGHDIK